MRFGAGESIVREGELSGRFYIITAGEVEVLQHVDGGERPIRRLHAGDHFGEPALLGDRRRTSTLRAPTDTSGLDPPPPDLPPPFETPPPLHPPPAPPPSPP